MSHFMSRATQPGRDGRRGAALVIVLAILTVLLAIGLSYFTVTRLESQIATNVVNTVRAEQLLDGAFSLAQYQLNVDLEQHPNVTSPDFSWNSLFNGTAFIGKNWAWRKGIPAFDITDVEQALRAQRPDLFVQSLLYVQFTDGYRELLFRGPRTLPWLWIPRFTGDNILLYLPENQATLCNRDGQAISDTAANTALSTSGLRWRFSRKWRKNPGETGDPAPWLLPAYYGSSPLASSGPRYPLELIHEWAHVDTDGDGLRDALWIPVPRDLNLNGDGVDNDLDGNVDPIDSDPNHVDAQGTLQRYFEPGAFAYRVRPSDGGVITNLELESPADIQPNGPFRLTVPLPGAATIIDLNNDGLITDADRLPNGEFAYFRMPDQIPVKVKDPFGERVVMLGLDNVDTQDNDYDRQVNGFQLYACTDANAAKRSGMKQLNPELFYGSNQVWPEISAYGLAGLYVACSGEPVCDIIGRVAVRITDEASKVNLNTAGAFRYELNAGSASAQPFVVRAFGQGVSPFEYELRMLPGMGTGLDARLWGWKTGAGVWTSNTKVNTALPQLTFTSLNPTDPAFSEWDLVAPGYGRVDDNANSLILAFNRRDDNGDGIFDTGVGLNPPLEYRHPALQELLKTGATNPPAQVLNRKPDVIDAALRLGLFEGIDEPGEWQYSAPLRHREAERNQNDDNNNGVVDERGELGDKIFTDVTEAEKLAQFDDERMATLLAHATAQSDSRNVFYLDTPRGKLAFNKVDPNYATPLQLATTFMLAENLGPGFNHDPAASPAEKFLAGLRRGDATLAGYMLASGLDPLNGVYNAGQAAWRILEEDPFLRALQLAVNLVDNRDRDAKASRITLPREQDNRMPIETERVPPQQALPLNLIQDFKTNAMGMNDPNRSLDTSDPWWEEVSNGQKRSISYTVAGADAIRINEVMVRPVRRIEAETNRTVGTEIISPSPFGLPTFNVQSDGGTIKSTSNYLGDRTAIELLAGEVYEIAIRPSDWVLPPGRYYLLLNATDTEGIFTPSPTFVADFQYCVYYTSEAPNLYGKYADYVKRVILDSLGLDENSNIAEINNLVDIVINQLFPDEVWSKVSEDYIATDSRRQNGSGMPPGWIFLPSEPIESGNVPQPVDLSTVPPVFNYLNALGIQDPQQWFETQVWSVVIPVYYDDTIFGTPAPDVTTYTVSVPPPGRELRIRIRNNGTEPIYLNFFDLSQEPDHEWIELVNTSDEAVDLSGWRLEIGIPDPPGATVDPAMADPYKSKWTIPEGTVIAPKGYLLLAFTEPPNGDQFENGPDGNRFYDNGIGLKQSNNPPYLRNVTVPPFATRLDPALAATMAVNEPALTDPTYSVFSRPDGTFPFVDNDGDGLSSLRAVQPDLSQPNPSLGVLSNDLDNTLAELATHVNIRQPLWNYLGLSSVATTPGFARIVSLRNDQLFMIGANPENPPYPPAGGAAPWTLPSIAGPEDIARVLLRGGILPNYPDHDGYDNDGDGGYLVTRDTTWYYVPGTLDTDNIDNNLDGYVDVYCGYNVGSAAHQKPAYALPNLPLYSEGVDEGDIVLSKAGVRRFRYGYGGYAINRDYDNRNSFETGTLPMAINPDLPASRMIGLFETMTYDSTVPPDYLLPTPPRETNLLLYEGNDPTVSNPFLLINNNCALGPLPATGPLDSPDWVAFAERRWNPGDCVIISLYAGEAKPENLVDRVTYNEYDVINRTIDDIAMCPYPESLARPTYWPPNHMALDFYRSLERKHPLYPGDLHGVSNRWEATDGAYDDWADSLSWFEAVQDRSRNSENALIERFVQRFNLTGDPAITLPHQNRNLRLFGHAMFGSPLRMNTQARLWENPPDLLAAEAPLLHKEEEHLNNNEVRISPEWAYGSLEPALTARLPQRQFGFYGTTNATFVEPLRFDVNQPTRGEYWTAPLSPAEAASPKVRSFPTHLLNRVRSGQAPYATAADWLNIPLFSFRHWLGRGPALLETTGQGSWDLIAPRGIGAAINTRYWSDASGRVEQSWPPVVPPVNLNAAFQREDPSLKTVTLAGLAGSAAPAKAGIDTLALTTAMEPVVLTVGQADFIPLWPNPVESPDPLNTGASAEQVYEELLTWKDNSLGGWTWDPETGLTDITYRATLPAMWTPVLLFGESTRTTSGNVAYPLFPYGDYPPYARSWSSYTTNLRPTNAAVGFTNAAVPVPYLFEFEFLAWQKAFGLDPQALPNGTMDIANRLEQVWPATRRPAMYITSHPTGMPEGDRAEALFVWDAEDGLENGSYIVYVGTFVPGTHRKWVDADRIVEASRGQNNAQRANSGLPYYPAPMLARAKNPSGTAWPPLTRPDYTTADILALDPERLARRPGEPEFASWLTVEFYTDPRKAKLMSPPRRVLQAGESYPDALPHPEDWYPPQGTDNQASLVYVPDSDGMILYATNPDTPWMPKLVHVTNRFLALRVRNASPPGQAACVTCVVLTPVPRTRGRINLNTAENRLSEVDTNYTVFNPLMGLPGTVVAAYTTRNPDVTNVGAPLGNLPASDDAMGTPVVSQNTPWPAPDLLTGGLPVPPAESTVFAPQSIQERQRLLPGGDVSNNNHYVADEESVATLRLAAMLMTLRPDHADGRYYEAWSELLKGLENGTIPLDDVMPLSNEGRPDWRADEIIRRFSGLAQLITLRSDVFEILGVAQAGNATDTNGDGFVDYLSTGDGFQVTAESRGRMVYERRARRDTTDQSPGR